MASFAASTHTAGRGHPSPRPKARGNWLNAAICSFVLTPVIADNAKNILCRNITIYGSCRAQNTGQYQLPI